MAFGIFYNRQDLQLISNQLLRDDLPGALKTKADLYWDQGLRTWDTAPIAPVQYRGGDDDCREVVISGPGVHCADFAALLQGIAQHFGSEDALAWYMDAIGGDVLVTGVEPYNP